MATGVSINKRDMEPGFYVVRMPSKGTGSRLIVESRPFRIMPGIDREWTLAQAESWRDYIQTEHPLDDVFVIER